MVKCNGPGAEQTGGHPSGLALSLMRVHGPLLVPPEDVPKLQGQTGPWRGSLGEKPSFALGTGKVVGERVSRVPVATIQVSAIPFKGSFFVQSLPKLQTEGDV